MEAKMAQAQIAKKQTNLDRIKLWQQSSPAGFLAWLHDVRPKILMNSTYREWIPTENQLEIINQILKPAPAPIIKKDEPVNKLNKRAHGARIARPSRKHKPVDPELSQQIRKSSFAHSMSLTIAPRRHSKTSIMLLITLWLASSRRNFCCQLIGSTESHTPKALSSLLTLISTFIAKTKGKLYQSCHHTIFRKSTSAG
jgi:hypothetical protein